MGYCTRYTLKHDAPEDQWAAIHAALASDAVPALRQIQDDHVLQEEMRAGRFTVPTKAAMRGKAVTADLHQVLSFTKWPGGRDQVEEHLKSTGDECGAKIEAVKAEARRIVDELVLGDASEALSALRAFEAREF